MPSPLYADENVDRRLVEALRSRGWDVVEARERHPPKTPDEAHMEEAAMAGRFLLTRDPNFLAIAARWQAAGRPFAGVIFYVRWKFRRIGDIVRALEALSRRLEQTPLRDRVHFL